MASPYDILGAIGFAQTTAGGVINGVIMLRSMYKDHKENNERFDVVVCGFQEVAGHLQPMENYLKENSPAQKFLSEV